MDGETQNWFTAGGDAYVRYRPDYPDALAAFMADIAPNTNLALDVGCGSGQFTVQLGEFFATVVGYDPSFDQISHARRHRRVHYEVCSAEKLPADDGSASLITAAQAAHWFDLPKFYAEARRVAIPGAVIALVSYGVAQVEPDLDARFETFYSDEIGPYWPPERKLVDSGYRDINFPFRALPYPPLAIRRDWSAADFLGYVSTWSAVRHAHDAGDDAVLKRFSRDFLDLWGDPSGTRQIIWPINMRLGVID